MFKLGLDQMHLQVWGMFDVVDARVERGDDGGEGPQERHVKWKIGRAAVEYQTRQTSGDGRSSL